MPTMNKKAFTLVELIVVITIIAVLGTIAFVSFQDYSSQARDTKTVSDINNAHKKIALFKIESGFAPKPDNSFEVLAGSGNIITYQGEFGTNVKRILDYGETIVDSEGNNYKYATNGKYSLFTLVGFLEQPTAKIQLLSNTYANNSNKFLKFKWDEILTLFNQNNDFISDDVFDLQANNTTAYIGNNEQTTDNSSGKSIVINIPQRIVKNLAHNKQVTETNLSSCKEILEKGESTWSGPYTILINQNSYSVYCDMETDNGGWTLASVFDTNWDGNWAFSSANNLNNWTNSQLFWENAFMNPYANVEQKYISYTDIIANDVLFVRATDKKNLLRTSNCNINSTLQNLFTTPWQTDNPTPLCGLDKVVLEKSFDHALYNSTAGSKSSTNFGALSIKISDASAWNIHDDNALITTTNWDVGYIGGIQTKGDTWAYKWVSNGEWDWNNPKQANYALLMFIR